jgi:UDP-N-acetylmuramoylalanine--D-glutamate ligase
MLASILSAAGRRTVAAGNVGLPLLDAVLAEQPYDVLAVELSSFQLHWSTGVRPHTAVVLNVAPDHVDWHGSLQAYAEAKGRIHAPGTVAVYNREDEASVRLARAASSAGRRGPASRSAARPPARLGVVEDLLVDRAFPDVAGEATALAVLADLPVPGAHNVANALAAAALARSYGVPAEAVAAGLRAWTPDPHRNAVVPDRRRADLGRRQQGHQPARRRRPAWPRTRPSVWIAGGLLKGADVEDLVADAAGGCARWCCSGPTARRSARRWPTRARCPSRGGRPARHWRHARRRLGRP